jgi:hypothetical protein
MRRASRPSLAGVLFLFALLWAAPPALHAQFGTKELTAVIPTADFLAQSTAFTYFNEGFTYLQVTAGNPATFLADSHLPVGAKVNQVCALVRDDDATGEVFLDFSVIELGGAAPGPSVTPLGNAGSGGAATPHYSVLCVTPPANTAIRAFGDADGDTTAQYLSYRIGVSLKASNNLSFGGAIVKWQRQQAPAPAAATFADVPTNFLFFRAIENLAAAGITGGCAPGNFCPNANITRGEAAAFFSKALGLYFQQ